MIFGLAQLFIKVSLQRDMKEPLQSLNQADTCLLLSNNIKTRGILLSALL